MLSGAAGAYSGKIPFCAPRSRYRRGLLRQNPYLRPDIPVSTEFITAKFLSAPRCTINYYPCQGQSALSMPNFNEASLSDTLQLVYSYKILWETGSLIPFYIGHYYNN